MTGYICIGKRVKAAFGLFCLLFAFLAFHLYGVQIRRHDELYAKAREKYTIETKKENVRGEIFDHDGNLLVGNSPVGNIIADPCSIEKEEECRETAAFLAQELQLPVVENPCPQDKTSKRYEIKTLLAQMSRDYPDMKSKIFGAMQRLPLPGWETCKL